MAVYDWRKPAIDALFDYAAGLPHPEDGHILSPSFDEYLVLRAKFGTGKEEDDKVVSWATIECVIILSSLCLLAESIS
jgi:hypothetical protein